MRKHISIWFPCSKMAAKGKKVQKCTVPKRLPHVLFSLLSFHRIRLSLELFARHITFELEHFAASSTFARAFCMIVRVDLKLRSLRLHPPACVASRSFYYKPTFLSLLLYIAVLWLRSHGHSVSISPWSVAAQAFNTNHLFLFGMACVCIISR